MKKIQTLLFLILLLIGIPKSIFAQVSTYTFATTAGTYTPITGGTVLGNNANDNNTFNGIAFPAGFAFSFGGVACTHFAVNSNGFIAVGTSFAVNTNAVNTIPISNTIPNNNVISALGGDIASTTTGVLSRIVLGTAPSRVVVVQWKDYTYSGSTEVMNFQIKLYETTNNIEFVYGVFTGITPQIAQVGLRGANSLDYKNRITDAMLPNWSMTTAGASNGDFVICELDATVFPVTGTTFTWTTGAGCTGTPTAGTSVVSSASVCVGSSVTLSLTGNIGGPGITYQWQSSPLPIGTYTSIIGATTANYSAVHTVASSYRCVVTCTSSSLSANSTQETVGLLLPTYASVPYTQNFESTWNTTCVVAPLGQDIPDASWRSKSTINPNTAWRVDNLSEALSGWNSSGFGIYNPTGANTTARSARFHSYSTAFGAQGSLDFYVNLSGAGTKQLSFYYIKPSTGGNKLELFISTDGGLTFSPLSSTPALVAGGVAVTNWTQANVVLASSSATTVIRFTATGDGVSDIGLDEVNLSVLASCTGTPTAGAAVASTASTCNGNVTLSVPTASIGSGITYQWQSSPIPAGTYNNITGATSATYAATQIVGTSYRCVVSCGAANATSTATDVTMSPLASCYCIPVSAGVVCVTRVGIGAINNITTCGTAPNFYDLYPNTITTTLTQGISYPITVTTTIAADVSVWIDYNQNGTFDTSEWVQVVANATTGTVNITPSFAAIVGTTRMRVRSKTPFTLNTATDACTTFLSGDTEDYTISIASGIVCSTIVVTPVSSSPTYTIGVAVNTTLNATSSIVGATYTYAVTGGTLPAGLTFVGNVLSGNPTTVTASGTFTITATSAPGGCTGTSTYTFNVVANPVCLTPVVLTPVSSSPTYTVGTAVNTPLNASGGPTGTPTYTYSISAGTLPAGLTLTNGFIIGTPTTATPASPTSTFTIMATSNPSGCTGTSTYTYNVLAAPACTAVIVTPVSSFPTYTAGTAIPIIILSATGGVPSTTYTYSISAGALPAGVNLSGNSIFGTPSVASTGSFTVTATSVIGGCTGTSTFTFTVNLAASCTAVVVTPTASPLVYTIGTAITNITLGASGGPTTGTPTYAYAVAGLPSGLNFSGNTISGTPIGAPSTGSFTVTATSTPLGCTGSTTYNYTINAAAVCTTVFVTPATTSFTYNIGTTIPSIILGASGGAVGATYAYSVVGLPSGLILTGNTISGTPTGAGSTGSFTVTATSTPLGCIGSTTYNYTIIAPFVCNPVITTPPSGFRNYTVGTAIMPINFSATGGVTGATYTYVVTGLPAWATLIGNTITGTPPTTGGGSFTITATSTPGNCIGSSTINYNVTGASLCVTPVIVTPASSSPTYTVGTPITNIVFSATGGPAGTPTYTYALIGTLPFGLTLVGNTISGIPTTSGTGTFTIRAIASVGGCFSTSTFNYTVNPNLACVTPVVVTPAISTPIYTVGTSITPITFSAAGGPVGTPTYTYAVTSGTLPAGITLVGGVLSGTASTVGFGSFVITATSSPSGCTGTSTFNYNVVANPSCPTAVSITPATTTFAYIQNTAITNIVLSATGGPAGSPTYTYAVSAGALPAGVTLTGNTISGTPTTVGNGTFVISATASTGGCTGTVTYNYTVGSICQTSVVISPIGFATTYTAGTAITNITLTASGGPAGATTYAYAISAGALPAGVTLVGNVISGTPTTPTATGTFTVSATTSVGACVGTTVYRFNVLINPTTSIDNNLSNLVKVSPNPSNGDFNVDFGNINLAKATMRVYDAQGKQVFASDISSNLMVISLGNFASGIYLLEVETAKGRILKRLSKN